MSIFIFSQIAFNVFLILAAWVLWSKFRRPAKDDPRLSRGLQLLQSKISILEDLSDKTDHQINQIIAVLDKKCKELQGKVQEAKTEVNRVDCSIQRSLEVSEIFEDRIPHQEIIERQKTKKYVLAAQLAHQGLTPEEISRRVDIPLGELEMITKVNRDRLMFDKENLPAWAKESDQRSLEQRVSFQMADQTIDETTQIPTDIGESVIYKPLIERPKSLKKIGNEFRRVCEKAETDYAEMMVDSPAEKVLQQLGASAVNTLKNFSDGARKTTQNIVEQFSDVLGNDDADKLAAPRDRVVESVIEKEKIERNKPETNFTPVSVPEIAPAVKVEARPLVDVISRNRNSGSKRVTEHRKVSPDNIQKVEFPRIGLTTELR